MMNAFQEGFNKGYEKISIIGSDLYNLSQTDLENAFNLLEKHEFVVGPAEDGGFYLLGMRNLKKELFQNKDWGSDTVLRATLDDLAENDHVLLDTRNDVDHYEDIANIAAFQPFLKHMRK